MKVRWTQRCAGGCGTWLRVGTHAVRAHRGAWCSSCWAKHAPNCTVHTVAEMAPAKDVEQLPLPI